MRLSTRILVSYAYLATLLVVGAAGAAIAFERLGDNIGRVLGENFRSVQAGMRMLESLERQDSATLAILLGNERARADLDEAETLFRQALDEARANITIDAEIRILNDIDSRLAEYRELHEPLLTRASEQALEAYELQAFPRFQAVKESVRELIDVNHRAMQQADSRARRTSIANAGLHALLVAVALLSLAPLSRSMKRHVVARLEDMRSVSEGISQGDLRRRFDDRQDDELGAVARQLNHVLDRHQELEAELEGRTTRERELLHGLVAALPGPAVLLSRAGIVLTSTADKATTEAICDEARRRIPALDAPATITFDAAGRPVRMAPVASHGDPHLAWLALVDGA